MSLSWPLKAESVFSGDASVHPDAESRTHIESSLIANNPLAFSSPECRPLSGIYLRPNLNPARAFKSLEISWQKGALSTWTFRELTTERWSICTQQSTRWANFRCEQFLPSSAQTSWNFQPEILFIFFLEMRGFANFSFKLGKMN